MYCWKENILDMILEQGTSWSFQSITNFLFETSNFVNLQNFAFCSECFEKRTQNAQKKDRIGIERAAEMISATYKEAHLTRNIKIS